MILISEEYRQLNTQLHDDNEHYGARGHKFLPHVERVLNRLEGVTSLLDYGCGKGTLVEALKNAKVPFNVRGYDPAREEYSALPMPADVVVCNDVLEHVEPEHLDEVLKHMASLAKKAIVLTVATVPAVKTLADGRNAHLIVENARWWYTKLEPYFGNLAHFEAHISGFEATFIRRGNDHAMR